MLIVDAQVHFWHLPAVGRIAERQPSLRLLIDHFARVRGATDDAAYANQPALLALAKYPNVAVKATGAPGNSIQPDLYRNIHKSIQQIYDAFARSGCSGVPTSRACRARGDNA
jgi:predicted TIM-barrel fold metal-dependent hydrolase